MSDKRISDYKWLMNKLPVDLRPALAAEKKWFTEHRANMPYDSAITATKVAVRYETDMPSRVLTGLFAWDLSKAGYDFWAAAAERLQLAELHKQKEAERLAPIRAERARRHRSRMRNRRLKFMTKTMGYKT